MLLQHPSIACFDFSTFLQLEICQGVYQRGAARPANQWLFLAQGINSAAPGLAQVRHPGY